MASIIPGFAYDLFISYRHNDNRSGWVTEFVRALKEELAATIKEPVSVYFDNNPYDGLLETHNVDKSLEEKLKCLIFVPILSQTYSDPKSFAWQHEFCAFNKLSREGDFGRDVKLGNGNVASRILPVKIHDLDAEDIEVISKELGTPLRAIEMIYREPGVNRQLIPGDNRNDNLNKTDYRNQVNKIANTAKELIYSLQHPERKIPQTQAKDVISDSSVNERSIAVLPFTNLSQDPAQEYFADGITENIITELAGLSLSRLISRTSVMRFKKTTMLVPDIAKELSVKYILEGSVQLHKEKVRISVQLINAAEDHPVWSKVLTENTGDIFEIQSNVAEAVAKQLHASFNPAQTKKPHAPTKNQAAYDLFLKGRHAFNQWGVEGYKTATEYFKKAIGLDPEFFEAYSFLASSYSARMSWNGDLSPQEALKNIDLYLPQAWKGGPTDNDYLTKAFIEFFINKDFKASERLLQSALALNENNANVIYTYSYVLNLEGRFDEAAALVDRAQLIDPLTVGYFNYKAISLYFMKRYDEALATIGEGLRLFPTVVRFYDLLARIYITMGRYEQAVASIHKGFIVSGARHPSMMAWLSIANLKLGNVPESKVLISELVARSKLGEKGVNVYLYYATSDKQWLDRAKETNDVDLIWLNEDPLIGRADYNAAEEYLNQKLENEMPQLDYHNIDHIRDVFNAALIIAKEEGLSEVDLKLLRVAVLLHDIGFIKSGKGHEQTGTEIARDILPSFGFTEEQIETVCRMILATRLPQSPSTQLEKILCDADLDYLGRDNFHFIAEKLSREMMKNGVVETKREWNLVQKTFLESHRYHTEFSKTNRETQKQKHLQEIVELLKKPGAL